MTTYFWAAGLSGETAQFGLPTVDIDASFSDVFDNLDFAAMAIAEARNGRYSIFGDLIYTKLSAGSATPRGILATRVDVEAETFAGLVGAGYAVIDSPSGRVNVVGGARVGRRAEQVVLASPGYGRSRARAHGCLRRMRDRSPCPMGNAVAREQWKVTEGRR